ncbi:MAG: bifunctional nicotinamidase/pyrazinamidase [Tepidisphaeraceae bacterium]|jgi:nicotinamidase/pyrazinamidase
MKTLILVDIQNDFLPGGALPVPRGNDVIEVANRLMPQYPLVVATQDWHPADHGSFASQHTGKKPGDMITLAGLPQILWPDHCVQNTGGALFATGLNTRDIHRVFPKGQDSAIDSYSGFFDNGRRRSTGLAEFLRGRGVGEVHILGLATDYCVKFTALDAVKERFTVSLIQSACRGVDLTPGDCARAIDEMRSAGVTIA